MKKFKPTRANPIKASARSVDVENFRITHVVNSKALDRHLSIVLPKGANVENFMKNPVVLWYHNYDDNQVKLPIGKCVDISIKEDEITVTTEFNKSDPFSVSVFNAYKDGFLNAWSIGLFPKKVLVVDSSNVDTVNAHYGVKIDSKMLDEASPWGIDLIHEWDLLEYSAVAVPSNPEALTNKAFKEELLTRGLIMEDTKKKDEVREVPEEDKVVPETEDTVVDIKETEEETPEEPTEDTVAETEEVEETEEESGDAEPNESTEEEDTEEEDDEEEVEDETEDEDTEEETDDTEEDTRTSDISALTDLVTKLTEQVSETSKQLKEMKEEVSKISKSVEVDNIENIRKQEEENRDVNSNLFFVSQVKTRK